MKNKSNSIKLLLDLILQKKRSFAEYDEAVVEFLSDKKFPVAGYDYLFTDDKDTIKNTVKNIAGDFLIIFDTNSFVDRPKTSVVYKKGTTIHHALIIPEKSLSSEVYQSEDLDNVLNTLLDKYFKIDVSSYGLHICLYELKASLTEARKMLKEDIKITPANQTAQPPADTAPPPPQDEQEEKPEEPKKEEKQDKLDTSEAADAYEDVMKLQITIPFKDLFQDLIDMKFKPHVIFDYTKPDTYNNLTAAAKRFGWDHTSLRTMYPLLIVEFVCSEDFYKVIKHLPFLVIGTDSNTKDLKSVSYYTPEIKIVLPKYEAALKFITSQIQNRTFERDDAPPKVVQNIASQKVNELVKFHEVVDSINSAFGIEDKDTYQAFLKDLKEGKTDLEPIRDVLEQRKDFSSDAFLTSLVNRRLQELKLGNLIKMTGKQNVIPYSFLYLQSYYDTGRKIKMETRETKGFDEELASYEGYKQYDWFYSFFLKLKRENKVFMELVKMVDSNPKLRKENAWSQVFNHLASLPQGADREAELKSIFIKSNIKELKQSFMDYYTKIRSEEGFFGKKEKGQPQASGMTPVVAAFLDIVKDQKGEKNQWLREYFTDLTTGRQERNEIFRGFIGTSKRGLVNWLTAWEAVFDEIKNNYPGKYNPDKLDEIFSGEDNHEYYKNFYNEFQHILGRTGIKSPEEEKAQGKEPKAEGKQFPNDYPALRAFIVAIRQIGGKDNEANAIQKDFSALDEKFLTVYEDEINSNKDKIDELVTQITRTDKTFTDFSTKIKSGEPIFSEAKAEGLKDLFDPKEKNPYLTFLMNVMDSLGKEK